MAKKKIDLKKIMTVKRCCKVLRRMIPGRSDYAIFFMHGRKLTKNVRDILLLAPAAYLDEQKENLISDAYLLGRTEMSDQFGKALGQSIRDRTKRMLND